MVRIHQWKKTETGNGSREKVLGIEKEEIYNHDGS